MAFDIVIWAGAALVLAGLVLLVRCIVTALRIRRGTIAGPEAEAALRRLIPMNLGALMLSAFGLIVVVTGIILK